MLAVIAVVASSCVIATAVWYSSSVSTRTVLCYGHCASSVMRNVLIQTVAGLLF
jgi:hypothetical protein